jgi:para-aminobenzoate synthetase component 1
LNKNKTLTKKALTSIKKQCYNLAEKAKYACILDSNLMTTAKHSKYEFIAAIGKKNIFKGPSSLDSAIAEKKWIFGTISYSHRTQIEKVVPIKYNNALSAPDFLFFEPKQLIVIDKNLDIVEEYGFNFDSDIIRDLDNSPISLNSPIDSEDKRTYLQKISQIRQLILEGEVYEMNYCIPFKTHFSHINLSQLHHQFLSKNPSPMSCFLKVNEHFLMSASMERFIKKEQNTLISQPIKGTAKRFSDKQKDDISKMQLLQSEKERAENVMIVDLVRNDLARICESGSVKVEELFGIYSFETVHQMISTISGKLKDKTKFSNILSATFPMGSMTGAPKIAAQKFITELETFERGWYSGTVGYIEPSGNFDFNVVIRSLIGNLQTQQLEFYGGGAITIDSIPIKEWEEIQLKVKGMKELLK